MSYNRNLMEQGRKLVENGATLDDVRSQVPALKGLSRKTYERWADEIREDVPKVDTMMAMIRRQFDRLDVIAKERGRLDSEEAGIRDFLKRLNITERPQGAAA